MLAGGSAALLTGLPTFLLGLAVLVLGAELLVRAASRLALSLGVSPLVLGLTVVSIGTSAPELAVGVTATSQGSGSLAVGNIAGTNVFNLLFILGLSALLRPLPLHLRILRLELPVVIAASALMTALAWDGVLSPSDGAWMLAGAVVYTVAVVRMSRGESEAVRRGFAHMWRHLVVPGWDAARTRARSTGGLLAGIALTLLGADWLVDGAAALARARGVSEAVIGLTIVAVGTSAPELVTTVVSTLRDERDVAVGNLVGSSIYNILVILALVCVWSPAGVPVERSILVVDAPVLVGVTLACVPVFWTGRRVSRGEGGLFVGVYLAYMAYLLLARA